MATAQQNAWNAYVSATIGAAIAERRQEHQAALGNSWWVGVPREQWSSIVKAEVSRMRQSREAKYYARESLP